MISYTIPRPMRIYASFTQCRRFIIIQMGSNNNVFFVAVTLIVLVVNLNSYCDAARCRKSITTASGSHIPKKICSGDQIFEDDFGRLDKSIWQHENTLKGGGVSTY